MNSKSKTTKTSWENVNKWYDQTVGKDGHYYHQHIILPGILKEWAIEKCQNPKVFDLACGQGILARHLPKQVLYLGIDSSPSLIKAAKKHDPSPLHHWHEQDICKPLNLSKEWTDFTHGAIILALQNLEEPKLAIKNASKLLIRSGKFSLVINHPYFRIPRQSSWGVDEQKKMQYRRIDRYMSSLKIPIHAHPSRSLGQGSQEITYSFHTPLYLIIDWLAEAGFVIKGINEWCSDKSSTGAQAPMENRARQEFPLFMHIVAEKQ